MGETAFPEDGPASRPRQQKRRSPISRVEGEARLVGAAIDLLNERPFNEVGVREIAARADVNHGFVHTWFGGKGPLLVRVAEVLLGRIADTVRSSPGEPLAARPFDTDVQLAIRLVMWLSLKNGAPPPIDGRAVITSLTERFVTVDGLSPEMALLAAQQTVSLAVAAVVYGPMIGIDSDEAARRSLDQWRGILGLLAERPPA